MAMGRLQEEGVDTTRHRVPGAISQSITSVALWPEEFGRGMLEADPIRAAAVYSTLSISYRRSDGDTAIRHSSAGRGRHVVFPQTCGSCHLGDRHRLRLPHLACVAGFVRSRTHFRGCVCLGARKLVRGAHYLLARPQWMAADLHAGDSAAGRVAYLGRPPGWRIRPGSRRNAGIRRYRCAGVAGRQLADRGDHLGLARYRHLRIPPEPSGRRADCPANGRATRGRSHGRHPGRRLRDRRHVSGAGSSSRRGRAVAVLGGPHGPGCPSEAGAPAAALCPSRLAPGSAWPGHAVATRPGRGCAVGIRAPVVGGDPGRGRPLAKNRRAARPDRWRRPLVGGRESGQGAAVPGNGYRRHGGPGGQRVPCISRRDLSGHRQPAAPCRLGGLTERDPRSDTSHLAGRDGGRAGGRALDSGQLSRQSSLPSKPGHSGPAFPRSSGAW